MIRWHGWGRTAALAVLAILLAVPALAQGGSWVTVVRKQGTVESRLASSDTWLRIVTNRRLGSSDWARTSSDGAAQLRLADNSLVAMGPSTQVQLERFTLGGRERDTSFAVRNGAVRAQVSRFGGQRSRFQVSTPNAVLAAQGTDFLVTVLNPDQTASEDGWVQAQGGGQVLTRLAVFSGIVTMTNNLGRTLVVHPGGTAEIMGDGPPEPNPSGWSFDQANGFLESEPGFGDFGPQGQAPFVPFQGGTVWENFGSNDTGLTAETRETSTGQDGAPVLVNPQSETTGTLIIDLQPPSSSPSFPPSGP